LKLRQEFRPTSAYDKRLDKADEENDGIFISINQMFGFYGFQVRKRARNIR